MKWLYGAAIALKLQWDVWRFKRRAILLVPSVIMDFEDFLLFSHLTAYQGYEFYVMQNCKSEMEH